MDQNFLNLHSWQTTHHQFDEDLLPLQRGSLDPSEADAVMHGEDNGFEDAETVKHGGEEIILMAHVESYPTWSLESESHSSPCPRV
ncbi:hypothetical protein SADUNF_Sadunf10G0015800 [Salix dunnii]|uniref:Uncharacterized protein n=1 Tax=Salix dunnii TaxID=1413687 RepID=A0A835JRP2_9ROSI|nr:hypothetical protein SADUNF_Sadunf10G0015800 [Salix dunnii]